MNINEIKERFNVYAVKFKKGQQSSIEGKLNCPNIQSAEGWDGFVGIGPRSPHLELACTVCPVRLIADLGKDNNKSSLTLSSSGGMCNPMSDFYGADLPADRKERRYPKGWGGKADQPSVPQAGVTPRIHGLIYTRIGRR